MEEQNKNIEEDYKPIPHQEIIKDPKPWPLIIGVVVLILGLLQVGFFWWTQQRTAPAIDNYQSENNSVPVVDDTVKEDEQIFKPNIENDNSYVSGSVELYYKYKEGDKLGYNLFIKSNGIEKLLADDILFDAPGGGIPKFYETEAPNVVLLEAIMGDMGGYRHQYYYIDTDTEDVLKIVETQSDITIVDTKLTLGIEDNCPAREGLRDYEGGTAFLNNILVDNVTKYVYSPKIELECVDPGGFGDIYDPLPQIKFKKVSVDRTKVYFEVLGENFYYDIATKLIGQDAVSIDCLPEQRNADLCMELYQPVCATVSVQCIKAPCPPIEQTFSNSCNACKNELVSSYTMGECK